MLALSYLGLSPSDAQPETLSLPCHRQVERDRELRRSLSTTAKQQLGVELFVVVHKADRILGPFDALSFVLLESLPSAKCVKCYVKLNLHPRSYLSGVHSLPKQKVLSSLSCFLPGGFTKS